MSGILAHILIRHISPRCVCKPLCLDHLWCNIISLFPLFNEILSGLGSLLRMPCFLCFMSAVSLIYIVCFGNFCLHCTYMYISKDVDFISYKSILSGKIRAVNIHCIYSGRLSFICSSKFHASYKLSNHIAINNTSILLMLFCIFWGSFRETVHASPDIIIL